MSLSPSDPTCHERVRELHAAARDWIERSATAQRSEHLHANLPYVDLMFAFGLATLGDHTTASRLTEDARKVLVVPIPEGAGPQADQAVTAAVVRNFMFKAFRYRVEQALAGRPHSGPMSEALFADRDALMRRAGSGPVNNPYKLAVHVIDRFRELSRTLEPSEGVDPYADWTKHGDPMKRELAQLHALRDPAVLAERIRMLHRDGVSGKHLAEVQFYVLHEGLTLAGRVNEAFAVELLGLVPSALGAGTGAATESPDLPKKQGELLERALYLAGHFGRGDFVTQLVDNFTALVRSRPEAVRYRLANVVARQCIRNLKRLGLTNEVDRLLANLYAEVLGGVSVLELRKRHVRKPEAWASVLQTLLNLAGGWMFLGLDDRVGPILGEARNDLLGENASAFQPKDYTELARAYVAALGQGPPDACLGGMTELFRKMDPLKITNTWTTAQYYSRFHLNLVEDTVLALLPAGPDEPVPAIVQA